VSLQNKGRRSLPPVPVLALVGKRPPQEGGRSKARGNLGFQYGEGIVAWTRDPMTSFVPLLEELIDLTQSGLWRFDPQRIQVLQDGGSFYLRFRAARQQAAPLPVTFAWQPLGGEETPWAF
ncbi:MAG: hypothetical protein QJR00_05465, partial [Bacillota bacterium]|nr:hypothetical protein [Bacillota bacterium]